MLELVWPARLTIKHIACFKVYVLAGRVRDIPKSCDACLPMSQPHAGYDADGVVLKIDALALHKQLGDVGGDPRWAVAWKFPANEAAAKLLDITLAVGRTGQVSHLSNCKCAAAAAAAVAAAAAAQLHMHW